MARLGRRVKPDQPFSGNVHYGWAWWALLAGFNGRAFNMVWALGVLSASTVFGWVTWRLSDRFQRAFSKEDRTVNYELNWILINHAILTNRHILPFILGKAKDTNNYWIKDCLTGLIGQIYYSTQSQMDCTSVWMATQISPMAFCLNRTSIKFENVLIIYEYSFCDLALLVVLVKSWVMGIWKEVSFLWIFC